MSVRLYVLHIFRFLQYNAIHLVHFPKVYSLFYQCKKMNVMVFWFMYCILSLPFIIWFYGVIPFIYNYTCACMRRNGVRLPSHFVLKPHSRLQTSHSTYSYHNTAREYIQVNVNVNSSPQSTEGIGFQRVLRTSGSPLSLTSLSRT